VACVFEHPCRRSPHWRKGRTRRAATAAQEALNKGIIAAKVPDYLLAIRYSEARKGSLQQRR